MNSKPQLVFLDEGTLGATTLDLKALKSLTQYTAYFNTQQSEVKKRIQNAEIIVANKVNLRAQDLRAAKNLKLIAVPATGYNNVDRHYARQNGIKICNVPGYSTPSVAEHTLLMMLSFSHQLLRYHQVATSRVWQNSKQMCFTRFPFLELKNKTLGIMGYGKIGKEVARLAKAFGMTVLVAASQNPLKPKRKNDLNLKTVLQKSDFVTLHCQLNQTTQNLINKKTLGYFKKTAVLINVARGPLVDEIAIAVALKTKKLGGYGADAFVTEPLNAKHPLLSPKIKDQILFTPHMAWASEESKARLCKILTQNVEAFLNKKPKNLVV